jgi:hypothetical protein
LPHNTTLIIWGGHNTFEDLMLMSQDIMETKICKSDFLTGHPLLHIIIFFHFSFIQAFLYNLCVMVWHKEAWDYPTEYSVVLTYCKQMMAFVVLRFAFEKYFCVEMLCKH